MLSLSMFIFMLVCTIVIICLFVVLVKFIYLRKTQSNNKQFDKSDDPTASRENVLHGYTKDNSLLVSENLKIKKTDKLQKAKKVKAEPPITNNKGQHFEPSNVINSSPSNLNDCNKNLEITNKKEGDDGKKQTPVDPTYTAKNEVERESFTSAQDVDTNNNFADLTSKTVTKVNNSTQPSNTDFPETKRQSDNESAVETTPKQKHNNKNHTIITLDHNQNKLCHNLIIQKFLQHKDDPIEKVSDNVSFDTDSSFNSSAFCEATTTLNARSQNHIRFLLLDQESRRHTYKKKNKKTVSVEKHDAVTYGKNLDKMPFYVSEYRDWRVLDDDELVEEHYIL